MSGFLRLYRGMVADTFRQAQSTRLFWVMLGVLVLTTMVCLSVRVANDPTPLADPRDFPGILPKAEAERVGERALTDSGVRAGGGELTLGFGAVAVPIARSRDDAVRHLELVIVGTLADSLGVLLALLWTAGFLPGFLEPQSASVMLSKPVSRTGLVLGKYLGVVSFVALYALLFVAATWTALGTATGVWHGAYWLAAPLLALHFAVYYSVSTFFAVWTRSTVASAFGTLVFWFVTYLVNYAHHHLAMLPPESLAAGAGQLADIAYWVLPKPLDYGAVFFDAMQAENYAAELPELEAARQAGRIRPDLAYLSGTLFAATVLAIACYELEATDY